MFVIRTVFVVLRSYPTAVQTMSARNAYRFRSAHFSPRIVLFRKKELAQFTFWVHETVFIIVRFTLFDVNCAFIFDNNNYAIATDIMLLV